MEHGRDENQEDIITDMIRGEEAPGGDVTEQFLNESGEGDESLNRRDASGEVEADGWGEGELGGSGGTLKITNSDEPSGSSKSSVRTRRGPTKKLNDHERYRIEVVAKDGEPIAPRDVAKKFVNQCGVVVRDYIPITVREWHKPSMGGARYVGPKGKENLWNKLMVHFTLPAPEVDPDEEEPNEEDTEREKAALEEKVKQWALKKMAELFKNWKKRLHTDFILKDKTPDFDHGHEKIKNCWEEFVAYKKSEDAQIKSETNKANAAKKKYHHTMGPGGYSFAMPKWEKLEAGLLAKGITPEPCTWIERARNWFYGHGGTLDAEGKCIYNCRHKENPLEELPIEDIRKAVKDVEEGRFCPDRENDELTCGLGNKEHKGRTRGTPGSKPWKIAFPEDRKKYPDRSHQRRKEKEETEARAALDRLRSIEELLKQQQGQIDALSQQGTSNQSQRHMIEAAECDGGGPSNRKSSVASTEPARYPVDDITESTPCELHVKVFNLSMKVAVGYAVPIGPKPTFHFSPVPHGYAIVGVDEVMKGYESLKLEHPAGEDGEVVELGEAKKGTILWPKEFIVLPNWPPRPSTPQSSNPSSPPTHQSPAQQNSPPPPPHQSPAHQSSSPPPPHQSPAQQSSSPPPPPPPHQTPAQTTKSSGNRSPKRKRSPLPKVPHKNLTKRPYDYTDEETKVIANAEYKEWCANLKKPKAPEFPSTTEEKAAVFKALKTLEQPPPRLTPDYDRSIRKSAEANKQRSKSSSARSGKSVPQLGEQKNQSCPPLKVFSNTEVGSSRGAVDVDPELVVLYGEAASAQGLSIAQYLQQLQEFPVHEIAYKYRHGHPLVKPELVNALPTKMRRLHKWYMRASEEGANWIYMGYENEHFGHGNGVIMIEFSELFQLYQQDAIDKSILSAYCL